MFADLIIEMEGEGKPRFKFRTRKNASEFIGNAFQLSSLLFSRTITQLSFALFAAAATGAGGEPITDETGKIKKNGIT